MVSVSSTVERIGRAGPRKPAGPAKDAELIDLSPRAGIARRRAGRLRSHGLVLRAVTPVAILLLWQAVSSFNVVPPEVLPSPSDIIAAFAELIRLGQLQAALPVSLIRALIGLGIGGTAGLVVVAATLPKQAHTTSC